MQQKWWLMAAAVIGIGIAVILMQRPDTGDAIPEADMTVVDPLNFKDPGEGRESRKAAPSQRGKLMKRELSPRDLTKGGPIPMAQLANRRQAPPEAIFAGRASGPWTIIRRQLILTQTEAGKALANEIAPLVADLRAVRRDPMAMDWDDIVVRQQVMAKRIRGNETYMADETTQKSIERLEQILVEIEEDLGE